jgi:hypothetical protein
MPYFIGFLKMCVSTDIDSMNDCELPRFLDLNDSRQVLHITYGLVLMAKNNDGSFEFRDEIYAFLNKYEGNYYQALQKHIGKHFDALGI